ncbi:MAG: TIGR04283 family arsenosugar biosynthesis glycosyltransferase [Alphaproteobacteria bacterium]
MSAALSIIIPALNAADALPGTLAALAAGAPAGMEIIVADGGSIDGTAEVAGNAGARVVASPVGRGVQMAAGAAASSGDWLLFLHADTRPDPGWADAVSEFSAQALNRNRAAAFSFALDDDAPAARRLERIVAWRCRMLALPYGDQGLLISRSLYHAIGGFRPMALYEDVDLVRRIGRARLELLPHRAVTSAVRYRRAGYVRRPARNLICLALYYLGMPSGVLRLLYG